MKTTAESPHRPSLRSVLRSRVPARALAALGVALAAATALVGCSKGTDTQTASAPGQRRERVEVGLPPASLRESPDQDVRNSRGSLMRVVGGVHDAVTAPFPGTLEIDLPATNTQVFASAIALTGWPKDKPIPQVRLYFEIDFVGPQKTFKHGPTVGLAEALTNWVPIEHVRGTDGPVKLRVRGSFIGKGAPTDVSGLRMCFALPEERLLATPPPDLPNVLVISVDTLRADHLSCYGYARTTTPNLDALVAGGVLFERAYSPAPWTLPAYGSLFTGLWPADHRAGVVREREAAFGTDETPGTITTEHLCPNVPTLAEVLAARGYQTNAFVSNPYLGPASGVARGFQGYTSYQYNSQNGVDLALAWIGSRTTSRWFLFLHVIDPHMPYAPPRPYDTRWAKKSIDDLPNGLPTLGELRAKEPDAETKELLVDYYDGEIAFMDEQIGRLIAGLRESNLLDDTIVVLHSDHGEEFWEHGGVDHGHTQHDELLRVPLAIVWPKKLAAGRVTTRVRTLDVFPTLAELVGAKVPAGLAGASLVPLLTGGSAPDRDAFAEAILHGPREIKAVFSGREKLIATGAGTNHLFDTSADPKEFTDRSATAAERVAALRKLLMDHHARAKSSACATEALQLDAGARHRLGNIGYAGDDDGRPKKPAPAPRKP